MAELIWFSDPGHAWLAVSRQAVQQAGIADKVSNYSYVSRDRQTAYLEEDCDAGLFLATVPKAEQGLICENNTNGRSFIRNLPRFEA